jgi:hypothetical protein
MTPVRIVVVAAALLAAGCTHDTTTPSTTSTTAATTTTTSTTPTTSEPFAATIGVGGSAFYSFNIAVNGTVNVTLTSVGGQGVPATVQLGIGIGTPAGIDCSVTSSVTAGAGTAPQLTGSFGPGLFCVRIYDVGNLPAAASFSVTIAHS